MRDRHKIQQEIYNVGEEKNNTTYILSYILQNDDVDKESLKN